MTSLVGDLATQKNAWTRYGKFNEKTNGFDYVPALFLKPLRAELQFMEEMVHTQMFVGFVDAKRKLAELDEQDKKRTNAEHCINQWINDKLIARSISRSMAFDS